MLRWWVLALVWGVRPADFQLVADASIYNMVVEAVHNVFNNTCIIFMHTRERPMQSLGELKRSVIKVH